MGFAEDLRRIKQTYDRRADALVRKVVIDVATELVEKSPVGDKDYWQNPELAPPGYVGGRFRANWQYALSAPDISTSEKVDPSGGGTISVIVGKIPEQAAGGMHYITNSIPYGKRLEDGHSKRQAPNGMVNLTVLEFTPIVHAVARALNP